MLKLLLVILTAIMVTTLAMDNMHRVELGLIVGRPVHVRLFFLLLTSFLVGCFSAMFMNLYLSTKSKKRREIVRDTEGDDFFSD